MNPMKSNNVILIGMPGSGKSTVGVQLAKRLNLNFIDTDLLIQRSQEKTLQAILDEQGYEALRRIESEELMKLQLNSDLVATGGSAVYSEKAMEHLGQQGTIVYLQVSLPEILSRINDEASRGIARPASQSMEEVYAERTPLYEKFACLKFVNESTADIEALAKQIENL